MKSSPEPTIFFNLAEQHHFIGRKGVKYRDANGNWPGFLNERACVMVTYGFSVNSHQLGLKFTSMFHPRPCLSPLLHSASGPLRATSVRLYVAYLKRG